MNNNTLCIEDIMKKISSEIKEKGLDSSMLSFEDVPYKKGMEEFYHISSEELLVAFDYLNNNYIVGSNINLDGNKFVVFIKRIIRKCIKFYVAPIVAAQNAFNKQTVKVLNYTKNQINKSNNDEIYELKNRIEVLELSYKNLLITFQTLEEENKKLKGNLGK